MPTEDHVSSTSRSLLARVRDDDRVAWQQLVDLYAPLIYRWCREYHLAEQDIQDVFQEVFRSLASSIGSFRKQRQGDTFRGWLRTITRNKVRDHFRRQQRQPQAAGGTEAQFRINQLAAEDSGEIDLAEVSAESDDQIEYQQLFRRALELIRRRFHERTWKAFWKVVIEERTPQDVGQELSMRPGTVRVAKSRVLQCLRQELGDLIE